ncbi:MAG: TolC family protein [Bryobacteraceae bacterium]
MNREVLRQLGAVALCGATLWGQVGTIAPIPAPSNRIIRPYLAPEVPAIRMGNSSRLAGLVRAGAVYLTVQDAMALALENNIDLEVARYNPILAEWRLTRSLAGGALPGVPSSAAQVGSAAAGQGVVGSQQAAGVGGGGNTGNTGQSSNATVSQIGPVTQNLDPSIQQATTFSHVTRPQPNLTQSQTTSLVDDTRVYSASVQQGFLTGGSVTANFRGNYLDENSPSNLLNPSDAATLSVSFQHNLLRGFGRAVNARTITVSRMNVALSEVSFRAAVNSVVNQTLNTYYALVADDEDVKAKRSAVEVAQTLLENVREQVRIGSQAPTETIRSESQQATAQLALVNALTTRDQDELRMKSLISRNGTAEPLLASSRIVPTDPIVVPEKDDLPPLEEMVKVALANRTDILTTRSNLEASRISAIGTQNGLLPNLQVFGGESQAGLAGKRNGAADSYFIGGMGTALGQSLRRNFPTERIGAFFQANIRNDQAQADYAIDQLQLRQSEISAQKGINQVQVDVLNAVVALQQGRARIAAARENAKLAQASLEAEQKKYDLGASTPSAVIQQQRDLTAGQSTEVAARSSYTSARRLLQQAMGTILESNNVSIADVKLGVIPR